MKSVKLSNLTRKKPAAVKPVRTKSLKTTGRRSLTGVKRSGFSPRGALGATSGY